MKPFIAALVVLFHFNAICQEARSNKDQEIVFTDVSVINVESGQTIEHQTVITKNGIITSMGKSSVVKAPKNAFIVDGKGKFLMPGLAEMHAHVPPNEDLDAMKEVLMLFAVNGITTIRGMLGHPKHLVLRDMLRKGEIVGPHFYTTGPSLNGNSVVTPQDGARMVREQKAAGYDYLKLHPGLTLAKFDSIAATADAVEIPFVGHVSSDVGVWRAIEAGYSSIDHLDGFVEGLVPDLEKYAEQEYGIFGVAIADKADETRIPKLMKALKEKNISVVPTQSLAERWFNPTYSNATFLSEPESIYMNKQIRDQWMGSKNNFTGNPGYDPKEINDFIVLRRKLIKACHDHGVLLLLGCDAPQVFNVPGFSTHNELKYMVMAGLNEAEALRTGTTNVAKYLNLGNAGQVKENFVSDLVLLSANPLTLIDKSRTIEGVMIGDKWLSKEFIQSALRKLRKQ